MSVDFPIPGAPPTRTREPLTAPPPRTRSSSFIPVSKRSSWVASISFICLGRRSDVRPLSRMDTLMLLPAAFRLLSAGRSVIVFHAWQAGH